MPMIVPPVAHDTARRAAAERRSKVEHYLASIASDGLSIPRFLHVPDATVSDLEDRLQGSAAAATLARLRWQLVSDERLLLERAIDVVEKKLRTTSSSAERGSITISLEPLPWWFRRPSLYPWRVVIRAPQDFDFRTAYEPLADWVGIAVEQLPPSHLVPFGHCTVGFGGLEGVVGGIVCGTSTPHETFSLTCRHVISNGCGSLRYPLPSDASPESPDAVLIEATTNCFQSPLQFASDVYPARESDTQRLQVTRTPLRKHHPERGTARGWLKYPVGGTNHTGEFVRFPHYSVRPLRYKLAFGLLRWPPFQRWFACERDSGSWVIEEGTTRLWLGMVVAGYDDDHDTLVADGAALLDYFSTLMARSPFPPPRFSLIAQTWP
jgi:hypothetical protein